MDRRQPELSPGAARARQAAMLMLALLVALVGIIGALLLFPPRAGAPGGIAGDASPSGRSSPSPFASTGGSGTPATRSPSQATPQTPSESERPTQAPLTAGPTIGATPNAPSPTWGRIGRIDTDMSIMSVVGFAGGYVAVGDRGLEGGAFAFSANGRHWQTGPLSETVQDCAGNPTNDAYVTGAATDGRRVLVLGKRLQFTPETCGDPELGIGAGAITWLSNDGQTWTRSSDFAHVHAIASHAWAIPGGGWELSASSWDRPTAIWQSPDGLAWHESASVPEQIGSSGRGSADVAGTRLLNVLPDDGPLQLVTSSDGINWSPLPAQPAVAGQAEVTAILAPAGSGRPWIVVTATDPMGSSIWASADLGAWTRHAFPGQRVVTNIMPTTDGYLASAERFDLHELVCDG